MTVGLPPRTAICKHCNHTSGEHEVAGSRRCKHTWMVLIRCDCPGFELKESDAQEMEKTAMVYYDDEAAGYIVVRKIDEVARYLNGRAACREDEAPNAGSPDARRELEEEAGVLREAALILEGESAEQDENRPLPGEGGEHD